MKTTLVHLKGAPSGEHPELTPELLAAVGTDNPHEPIKIIEHYRLSFHRGNAIKYALRAGKKDGLSQDLRKAAWYLLREAQWIDSDDSFDPQYKLVRDGIVAAIHERTGINPESKKDIEGLLPALMDKLVEEAHEVATCDGLANLIEELADVSQVINDIMRLARIDPADVADVQFKKFQKFGGFTEGQYINVFDKR